MHNDDWTVCLDPSLRINVEKDLLEFEDLAILLTAIRDDLQDSPGRFRQKYYSMATGVNVGMAVERLNSLERSVRDYLEQWMDLRSMVGECSKPIRRRRR